MSYLWLFCNFLLTVFEQFNSDVPWSSFLWIYFIAYCSPLLRQAPSEYFTQCTNKFCFFCLAVGTSATFGFVFVPGTVYSNPLEWFSLASDKLHHNVPVSSTLNILGGQFTDSPQFCVVLFPPVLPCEPYLSGFSLDYQLSFESRILLDSTLFFLPVPLLADFLKATN